MSFASEDSVRNAFRKVRGELRRLGLIGAKAPLDRIECKRIFDWNPKDLKEGVMGFYCYGSNVIYIPSFFPAALSPYLSGRSLTNVFRHEFGHALADKYKKEVRTAQFKAAFGGDAFDTRVVACNGHYEDEYVSIYAQSCPQEDFAETFMFYTKNKGVLPEEFKGQKQIALKWRVIAALCEKIAGQNADIPQRNSSRSADSHLKLAPIPQNPRKWSKK